MTAYELGEKAFAEYVAMRGEGFNALEYWGIIHFMADDLTRLGDDEITEETMDMAEDVMDMDEYESKAFRAALGLIPITA